MNGFAAVLAFTDVLVVQNKELLSNSLILKFGEILFTA